MLAFFLMAAAGLFSAALSGAALAFDGSYFLFSAIENLAPMVPNRREIHRLLLQAPLFASQFTHDVGLLQAIMGVAYALVPLSALLLAWWMTRDRAPGMFLWAALGILIGPLAGQFALISEGALSIQLAWPLYLGALLGFRRREWLPAGLAGALIAVSHPYGTVLLGLAALLALVPALAPALAPGRDPARRRGALVTAGLMAVAAGLAAWRFLSGMNDYESGQLTLDVFRRHFSSALAGLPLLGIVAALLAGACVVSGRRRWVSVGVPMGALLAAGLAFALWAANPARWGDLLNFRFFLLPALVPIVALAALDALRTPDQRRAWAGRRALVYLVGGVFAVTLVLQSLAWSHLLSALRAAAETSAAACLSTPDPAGSPPPSVGPRPDWLWSSRAGDSGTLDWVYDTPLNHWSITALTLLVQGNTPRALALTGDGCATTDFRAGLPIAPWETRRWSARYFNLEPLRARLAP